MTRRRQRRERIARNRERRLVLWRSVRWGVPRDSVRSLARHDPALFDPPRLRSRAPSLIGFDAAYPLTTYQVPLRVPVAITRPVYWPNAIC